MNPETLQYRLDAIRSTWSERERRLRAAEARRRMEQLHHLLAPTQQQASQEPRLLRSPRSQKLAI